MRNQNQRLQIRVRDGGRLWCGLVAVECEVCKVPLFLRPKTVEHSQFLGPSLIYLSLRLLQGGTDLH